MDPVCLVFRCIYLHIYIIVRKLFESVLLWGLICCESRNCLSLLLFLSFDWLLNNIAVSRASARTLGQHFSSSCCTDRWFTKQCWPCWIYYHENSTIDACKQQKTVRHEAAWTVASVLFNTCCTIGFVAVFPLFLFEGFVQDIHLSSAALSLSYSNSKWPRFPPLYC